MNKLVLVGAPTGAFLAMLGIPLATQAAVDPANPCNIQGWYVNSDEGDRVPERKLEGFEFENTDLIHHATNFPLRFLQPGWYAASSTPSQPSFFSVEVRDPTTDAYGTLRWNRSGPNVGKWQITIGAATPPDPTVTVGTFVDADPVALLKDKVTKWGPFTSATRVVSFGVGYTKDPPGIVKTTVSAVNFQGRVYTFKCQKPVDPSPSPSTSTSTSSSPSPSSSPTASGSSSSTPSATTSSSPSSSPSASATQPSATATATSGTPIVPADNEEEGLPVTSGPKFVWIGVIGTAVAAIGAILVGLARKRHQSRH